MVLRGFLRHFFVDLNHEPQLDTITGNVATLTTRPPRGRSNAVLGGLLKKTKSSHRDERKILRDSESKPRTLTQGADTLTTEPRHFFATMLQYRSEEQNLFF